MKRTAPRAAAVAAWGPLKMEMSRANSEGAPWLDIDVSVIAEPSNPERHGVVGLDIRTRDTKHKELTITMTASEAMQLIALLSRAACVATHEVDLKDVVQDGSFDLRPPGA